MNSKQKEQLLARYDDNSLTAAEREQLDHLLQKDTDARAILNQYRQLNQMLAELPDPTNRADFGRFTQNVSLALDSVRPDWATPKTPTRSYWRRLAPLAAAAAIMIALILRFAMVNPSSTAVPSTDVERYVKIASSLAVQEPQQAFVSLSAPQHEQESQLTPKSVAVIVTRQQRIQPSSATNQPSGEVLCFVTTAAPKQNGSTTEPIISLF